jgi:Mg-chelatase subunit ChlD
MEDNFQTISQVMKGIVASFDMDVNNTHSPRVGIVTFNGPAVGSNARLAFDSEAVTQIVSDLSADKNALTDAIDRRPNAEGMTCISCGLDVAYQMLLSRKRTAALPVIVLLTDGSQTAGGDDNTAIQMANVVKDHGIKVFAFLYGDGAQATM